MRRLALTLALILTAGLAHAEASGPDAWRVVGVSPDDRLNVRAGPGTEYMILDILPYNARGIERGTCVPTITRQQYFALTEAQLELFNSYANWCVVIVGGEQLGWVNRRFLGEDP